MLEKLAKSIEEINVLAEHYRTCHNVAAIESLAKEHSISKEDMDAFIAGKRNFLLKVLLTRQSASATEKLTEEMLLLQDPGYATVIGTYLLDLARKDPVMKEVILQPHKTLRRCHFVCQKQHHGKHHQVKQHFQTVPGLYGQRNVDMQKRITGVAQDADAHSCKQGICPGSCPPKGPDRKKQHQTHKGKHCGIDK